MNDQNFDQDQERIDAVLQALGQAEPDAAMQARILSAQRRAEAAESSAVNIWRWAPSAFLSLPVVPWLAAAALLLSVGGAVLMHRHAPLGSDPDHAASVPVSEGAAGKFGGSQAGRTEGRRLEPVHEPTPGRVPHVSQRPGISLHATAVPHVSEARHGAPIASAEDFSFPAPPLPLTEQERLLLRLVKHEPPQQLAQLSKPVIDVVLQHQKDAVTEFFAPPPPLRAQQEPSDSAGQQ